jgi:hypothetical protein
MKIFIVDFSTLEAFFIYLAESLISIKISVSLLYELEIVKILNSK